MDENRHITMVDENGEELDCEIVMYYLCDKNNTQYIFYTDNSIDENGLYNFYASRYLGEEDGELKLAGIESEEEWGLLEEALEIARNAKLPKEEE